MCARHARVRVRYQEVGSALGPIAWVHAIAYEDGPEILSEAAADAAHTGNRRTTRIGLGIASITAMLLVFWAVWLRLTAPRS